MTEDQVHLLKTKRFLPLFVTQAVGALNDNVFKTALLFLVTYRIAVEAGLNGPVLVNIAAGIFILPFFLFSATAGQLADKTEKSKLIRWIKAAEVLIMALAVGGFWLEDPYFLMAVLFLMGTQSAFFGPLKYSILPDHLSEDELIGGNALIEAGTFLAILVGTIAGGSLILLDHGTMVISVTIVGLALFGFLACLQIPKAPAASPDLRININFIGETLSIIGLAREQRGIFLSILGISWFWLVGATFLAQFPSLAKDVFGANENVVTSFLALFSIGIAIGSLFCNKILNGEVTAKYVPFGALGMTIFIVDLSFSTSGLQPVSGADLITATAFLSELSNWRIVVDLLGIAICGGFFIVPLYAILQSRSDEAHRSRIIAANNIINALFMVAGAIAATVMLGAGLPISVVFLVLGVFNGLVAIYVCGLLPHELVRAFLAAILKFCYRVEVRGAENLKDIGDRAVIVGNHVSFLDGVLFAVFLPGKLTFAIDTFMAKRWFMRSFMTFADALPIDPTNPMTMKSLIKAVKGGKRCVIFPEGRLTVTGALMKIFEGPGMIADKADAPLVPIRIDGAQYTPLSRLKGKVRLRWFPKITITVMPPQKFNIPDDVVGRARRNMAGAKLYDVMSEMVFETCERRQTLFSALLDAQDIHGKKQPIVEDVERTTLTYNRLITASTVMGRKLSKTTTKGEYVGLLLPNSLGAAVTFFALQAFGRVPAMLNFSTGAKNMIAALAAAEVKTILTSRRFIEMAKLDDVAAQLSEHASIVYLEDVKSKINLFDKLRGVVTGAFVRSSHENLSISPDEAAVVLFTSGSEGTPKGVVLSHANLLANRYQLGASIDFNPTDIVFNALPMFHSFGLMGGTLLPMLSGIKTFLYPSPLHYRIVPALVYDTNATIMFGTDTFLSGYARVAHPYDFYSVRYIFAGAEKVKDETRRIWGDKFGLRILEGYGATETSPVISANTPMHYKAGTVGRLMPGIDVELEPVPGIDEGGKLIVTGPNVMLGYLRAENPGVLERTEDHRYDTGDIVTIDEDGFITIQGRAKRFAKIAGEMVSLTAVEGYANAVWPGHMHAVISVPDARKGEQLILLTDKPGAERSDLLSYAKTEGIAELMVPKTIQTVDAVPVLGTGKVDYVGVAELAGAS
jgi:acyl-[acyl-carrier-protein]-phospholipid O-acyltransferase/long-chain-fatty-acid--[acyl-carrier-protein] ligase